MDVLNIHRRTLNAPLSHVAKIVATLASKNDQIWPTEQWPRMWFKEGIKIGAKGGHGPIRYTIEAFDPSALIQFRFSKPHGFDGIHKLVLRPTPDGHTKIVHTINMTTRGKATLLWLLGVRQLHDALIEDAFDKLENQLLNNSRTSPWSWWVKFLRWCVPK